jgi:hypothetical protein
MQEGKTMGENDLPPALSKGFIRGLLIKHKQSLRSFGLFIVVATFIVKTEVRDHVKSVMDAMNVATTKLSDAQTGVNILMDLSGLAQRIGYIENVQENGEPPAKRPDHHAMGNFADDLAAQALLQATQQLITSSFTVAETIPFRKSDYLKELTSFRDKASSLGGGTDPLEDINRMNLLVSINAEALVYTCDKWILGLKTVYKITDIASLILYFIGGSLAFFGKIYGIPELDPISIAAE